MLKEVTKNIDHNNENIWGEGNALLEAFVIVNLSTWNTIE